jgi:ADP-heptose:LPS heptosyltransferase
MDREHKILLIRLGGLGDVVFMLPAVHLVRTAFPTAQISFLVAKAYAPLLSGFREVDAVIPLDRAAYRSLRPWAIVAETYKLLCALRRRRFALAVDFQGFGETAWLTRWSGAPQRWGSVYRPRRGWAYTHTVRRDNRLHPAEGHLEVLRQAGGLEHGSSYNAFHLPEAARHQAWSYYRAAGLDPQQPTVFIQPLTGAPQKNWPLEHYLELAQRWRADGLQVLFGGGPGEQRALEPARQAGFVVAAGAPLLLSAGLAALATIVLGGDTGLVHLAAAAGKRVVILMRSIGPGAAHPYGHKEWAVAPVPGAPFSTLSPSVVDEACRKALAEQVPVAHIAPR